MEPLYNIKETPELKPQEFKPGGGLFGTGWMTAGANNISLFPVPQANTVGTNSIHNAITLISFPGKRMSMDNYFKNAVDDIRGGGIYIPVISKDVIGLGQVRRFMTFDFKKKTHRKHRISEKYSNYLGSPIMLLNYYFNDNKSAWTTNPTSFVGSRGESLYRWDLENQDYPDKDKMSFHDYIVQEDLKKLTKEKKQGLGK